MRGGKGPIRTTHLETSKLRDGAGKEAKDHHEELGSFVIWEGVQEGGRGGGMGVAAYRDRLRFLAILIGEGMRKKFGFGGVEFGR